METITIKEACNAKDLVCAFACGTQDDFPANIYIAEVAIHKANELDSPIYAPWTLHIPYTKAQVKFAEQKGHKPPSQLRIAKGCVEFAKKRGAERIWISAAKPQLWLCTRDILYAAERIGFTATIKPCEMEPLTPEYWFDPGSWDRHTRSLKNWERRVKTIKRTPLWLYNLTAS